MKRLTDGQRKARAAVKEAARRVIAEVDALTWRKECVEFRADFHLSCIRYDAATSSLGRVRSDMPIYRGVSVAKLNSPRESGSKEPSR